MDRRLFVASSLATAFSGHRRGKRTSSAHRSAVFVADGQYRGHRAYPGNPAVAREVLPEAEILLWPSRVDNGVDAMLLTRFPKLRIIQGDEALQAAFREGDFCFTDRDLRSSERKRFSGGGRRRANPTASTESPSVQRVPLRRLLLLIPHSRGTSTCSTVPNLCSSGIRTRSPSPRKKVPFVR